MNLEKSIRRSFQDVKRDIENLNESIININSRLDRLEYSLTAFEQKNIKQQENSSLIQIRDISKKSKKKNR